MNSNGEFVIFAILVIAFLSFIFFIFYIIFESDEDRKKKSVTKSKYTDKRGNPLPPLSVDREDKILRLKRLYAEKYIWAMKNFGIDHHNPEITTDPETDNFWLWKNVIVIGKSWQSSLLNGQDITRYRYPRTIPLLDTEIGSTKCCADDDAPKWVYQFMVDFIHLIESFENRISESDAAEYDELKIDYRNLLTMGDRFKHNPITLESITEY